MRAHRVFMSFAISIGCGIAIQNAAFSQEYRGTMEQQFGDSAARRSPMWTGLWPACSETLHNLADDAVRCLNKAPTRPDVETTSRRLTIGTMCRGVTATMVTIAVIGQDLMTTMTTKRFLARGSPI